MKKNKGMIVGFLAPAVIIFLIVFLYPIIRTVLMSFFDIESVTDSFDTWTFVGIENYMKLFKTPIFVLAMKNIFKIWLIGGIIVMLLSLLFGVILTSGIRGKKFFRAVIYLPNIVSAVALATMWRQYVFAPDYGLFAKFFQMIGADKLAQMQWLAPENSFKALLIAYCFGMVGYHMLIFMSGIEQIPNDYYEAALIEGANIFKRFTSITLPFLRGVLRTNIVMWTVYTVGFFVWGQLFSPVNLSNDTVAPMNYMYELVFGSSSSAATARNSGAGAAIGVIMCLIVVAVFFATNRIVKNDDIEL